MNKKSPMRKKILNMGEYLDNNPKMKGFSEGFCAMCDAMIAINDHVIDTLNKGPEDLIELYGVMTQLSKDMDLSKLHEDFEYLRKAIGDAAGIEDMIVHKFENTDEAIKAMNEDNGEA